MTEEEIPPIEIQAEQIEIDTLQELVKEFVLREGTDYGVQEVSLTAKVTQVLRQIEKGEVKILFDPNSETVTLHPHRK